MKIFAVVITLFLSSAQIAKSADWDYEMQGADWTETCETGTRQSPIDIPLTGWISPGDDDKATYNFGGVITGMDIERVKGNLQVTPVGTPHTFIANLTGSFEVLQYHLHHKTEHTFDGVQRELELHIVHKSTTEGEDDLVVVGVTFEVDPEASDADTAFLQDLLMVGYTGEGEVISKTCAELGTTCIDVKNMPHWEDGLKIVRYEGSLTTPGCDEIVTWYVVKDPLPMTEVQQTFYSLYLTPLNSNGNYRVVEDKNPDAILTDVVFNVASYSGASATRLGVFALILAVGSSLL